MTEDTPRFSVLKLVQDLRADADLMAGMADLLRIVKASGLKTAETDKDCKKGFMAAAEALDIAIAYIETENLPDNLAKAAKQLDEKGKVSTLLAFSLARDYGLMCLKLKSLGEVLSEAEHAVTKAFAENITTHPEFDKAFGRVWEKADGKMLCLEAQEGGGVAVFETLSGQNLRLFSLSATEFQRIAALAGENKSFAALAGKVNKAA